MGLFSKRKSSGVKRKKAKTPEEVNYDIYSQGIHNLEDEWIQKGMNNQDKTVNQPLIGNFDLSPDFKEPPSMEGKSNSELFTMLKRMSTRNGIVNSIMNTRISQVSNYCRPARYSDRGVGYEVRLKDPNEKPSTHDIKAFQRIESMLEHTSKDTKDFSRESFSTFVKKIIFDTYRYDKVNFELTYDENEELHHFNAVDAATIYQAISPNGGPATSKDEIQYVQIIDRQKQAEYSSKEMAWEVRRPRTDIESGRYGISELEQAMRYMTFHNSTEEFNHRYFSQGGTVRGLLQIKSGEQQSSYALDAFRREWTSMFAGMDGAWKVPVVNADDVKFVNMTQTSKDMEFEKWLNYNINIMCAIFCIDPAEIGFPNRGGATGSSGGGLNEGNSKDKTQASQSKGLEPLLRFVEDIINKYIISQFSDKYTFQFVGGDSETEKEVMEILALKLKNGMSFNEAREELGLAGTVPGGEATNAGVTIQYLGQQMQKEMMEKERQDSMNASLMEQTGSGMDGSSKNVNGKDTTGDAGKDGQLKSEKNTNSAPQGGKQSNGKPNDWATD